MSKKTLNKMSTTPLRVSRRQSGLDTKPDVHYIVIVTDRSASMHSMGTALAEQLGALGRDLRTTANDEGVPTFLTIVTFDDRIETFVEDLELHGDAPLPTASEVAEAVAPRGMTRFYDTIIMGLDKLVEKKEAYIAGCSKERRDLGVKVLISLPFLTDGMDNQSSATAADFKKKYEALGDNVSAYGLFANISADEAGAALGLKKETTIQMTPNYEGATQCLRAVSNCLRQASSGTSSGTSFKDNVSSAGGAAPPLPSGAAPPLPFGNSPLPLRRY